MSAIQISAVDVGGLPYWPHRVKALADMHRQLDRNHSMRQYLGLALAPPLCSTFGLDSSGLVLVVRRVP